MKLIMLPFVSVNQRLDRVDHAYNPSFLLVIREALAWQP